MAMGKFNQFISNIFNAPDPYARQKESIRRIIKDIQLEFPEVERSLKTQANVAYGGMARRAQDYGAATGAPASLTAQRLIDTGLGTQRNLLQSLGEAKQRKSQMLMNIASLVGGLPGDAIDTSVQDLMSLSTKWATGGFAPLVLGAGGQPGGMLPQNLNLGPGLGGGQTPVMQAPAVPAPPVMGGQNFPSMNPQMGGSMFPQVQPPKMQTGLPYLDPQMGGGGGSAMSAINYLMQLFGMPLS